jgi:MFS family permease
MHGLYLLWWVQEKQLPAAVVAASLAAGDFIVLAAELPSGWFADRFGHRASLILGSLCQVMGMLWCWLGEGVPGLLIAGVFIGIGDAFRSGADQAFLYRSCLALNREPLFQQYEARARAIETIALAGLVVAGGVIVNVGGFGAGWLAETLLCAAGLAIACAMTEPPAAKEAVESPARPDTRHRLPRRLALAILPAAFLASAAGVASFLAQTAAATDATTVTVLVAAITLAEAAGAGLALQVRASVGALTGLSAAGAAFLAAGTVFSGALVFVAPLLALLDGLSRPLRATLIQRLAADDVRARVASAASACDMAVSTIALPLAGVWRQRRRW